MALSFNKVRTQAALVAGLCVGTGALAGYLLITDLTDDLRRAESAHTATEVARRLEMLLQTQTQRLTAQAAQRDSIQVLSAGTRADRQRRAVEIRAAFPEAAAVLVLARGDTPEPADSVSEGDCSLPLRERPEAGAAITFLPVNAGSADRYAVVQPISDAQQQLLGHVMVCFPVALIARQLAEIAANNGNYAELRQARAGASRTVFISGKPTRARGAATVTSLDPFGLQLAYWPAAGPAWRADQTFYLLVIGLGIAGLLATAYAFHRATAHAVQHDIKSLALMSQDVHSGQMREDYPVELRDFAEVFRTLRDFGRRLAEEKEKLKELGLIDHLSQLSNRRHFEMRLNDLYELSRTRPRSSVLIMDIDRFKAVNDRLGHEAGDALIIGISHALRRLVRHTDILARLGGDEFCIIYACTTLDQSLTLAHRLRAQLPQKIMLGRGIEYPLRWSGGISVMLASDTRSHDVLWRADQALIRAKRSGGNMTLPYDASLDAESTAETPTRPA